MDYNYSSFWVSRLVGLFVISILVFIGCLAGFIVTGHNGALAAVIIIGIIDSLVIFVLRKQIIEYFKWLAKGIDTGEWR